MINPIATYRIQFHKEFTFANFEKIISYLRLLGVSTVYASPVFEAVPGSTHGYDGVNPHRINPEIGSMEELRALNSALKEQHINWLQDIVPNHMAFHPKNTWLMDVLEKGPQSVYATFFDTSITSNLYQGRIMVPFLGSSLEEVITNNELKVEYHEDRFVFSYYDSTYPLNPRSYAAILQQGDKIPKAIQQLLEQIQLLIKIEDAKAYSERWHEILLELTSLYKIELTKSYIQSCVELINEDQAFLKELADGQYYHLCRWSETDKKINYRRFFTVNGLICINIQDKNVFDEYHKLIKSLVDEGIINGLRIDHIDGLFDPEKYLTELKALVGDDKYVAVEKILEPKESLPDSWTVEGNTGYDFLSLVNNLFTKKSANKLFTKFYKKITDNSTEIQKQIRDKKTSILFQYMGGELENLVRFFVQSDLVKEEELKKIQPVLKDAIAQFLIHCPVYRYYGNSFPLKEEEATAIEKIFAQINKLQPELDQAIAVLEEVLIKKTRLGDTDFNKRALAFYQRCMQFTGPLMAKGIEDTLMYTYNRFIGHNEVGDSPEAFGISVENFHNSMIERQKKWLFSINSTSTHDTKRGEDVRARLNVLTELPEKWIKQAKEWQQLNAALKKNNAPDWNDEYFIYQTMLGAFPMQGQDQETFKQRLKEYLEKALREGKVRSNWSEPDLEYEEAVKNFIEQLFDQRKPFWKSFNQFYSSIADFGISNSLSQLILKFTCPGIPDVYQGTELWDLSLVDPDNRRPVDYQVREVWLKELQHGGSENFLQDLWQDRSSGKIKLWLTQILYNLRKENPTLFSDGSYIPLKIKGKLKKNVLAFLRQSGDRFYVIVVPLYLAGLCQKQEKDVLGLTWKNTRIILPESISLEWENILDGTKGQKDTEIPVKEIFKNLPFGILKLQKKNKTREAGILLSITSLPSSFGIGDLGPQAKEFARFLSRSKQTYWQLLPLNPTTTSNANSPYSSFSAMAGNTLLISPEKLVKDGLLTEKEVLKHCLPIGNYVDYKVANEVKLVLFEKAFQRFKSEENKLKPAFDEFCEKEKDWLSDFALYTILRDSHQGNPWFQWPDTYKNRETSALEKAEKHFKEELEKVKFLQFIFFKQWDELKAYCKDCDIKLFGDLPFYISYDSADVWANQSIFNLDENGKMTGVAGVPPDYFSENGQLWGMPTFRWDVLKEQGYDWWLKRLERNLQMYNLLRLDHFRAFADYWEVPAGEETAKNGSWQEGPGNEFFQAVKDKFGKLPFVAEDLGDINEKVHQLREKFALPGMKVLQFAFGNDAAESSNIPHNYTSNFVAYTGTHDNNTICGWYRTDADKQVKKRVNNYFGKKVISKTVNKDFARLAYSSVARIAILPLQDVIGLNEKSRMNTPGLTEGNWLWRFKAGQLTKKIEKRLRKWVELYNRG
ncbi:malto-oligosyltrehalose synthase [Rubrolithibacter danxiaensis]|uniref:malto-oligosyltrehalose synthase n=1 Tax=Rubrolithibacter danxiaensis TaxID=3390805 RepID=UPI003BF825D4